MRKGKEKGEGEGKGFHWAALYRVLDLYYFLSKDSFELC